MAASVAAAAATLAAAHLLHLHLAAAIRAGAADRMGRVAQVAIKG